MEQFINALDETFENNSKIKLYKSNFEQLKTTNPRLILDKFMENVRPIGDYIVNKNEQIFYSDNEMVKKLNLKDLWNESSDNTKEAIWQHLNTLYVFGSTISMIPENMMSSIESLAQQCAQNMDSTNGDPMELMKGMQNMLLNK
tara:strand:- start:1212 stop:1643 length:432 start_codon:yes stop_codon:yes gene_type:complete